MKIKFKILTIMMAIVLILASCGSNNGGESPTPTEPQSTGNNTNSPVTTEEKSKYFFEHNGISIYMNDKAEPVLDALGEPMHYFESPSCAFQGIDRVYTYSGFELYTYTDGDDDTEYIFSVVFMNDGVETREGITLSNKLNDIISKYGNDYDQKNDKYTYTDANTTLAFVIKDEEVVDVSYNLIVN
ncbi:MAG: hypothetical protein ACOYEI_03835 [Acetivibrionales bacterium]|jgi:hypothetical protein|nr:hypothetical protein [Clostridiaceae bacterium]